MTKAGTRFLAVSFLLLTALPGWSEDRGALEADSRGGHGTTIRVRLYNYTEASPADGGASPAKLAAAQETTGKIFDRMGLAIHWLTCKTDGSESNPVCRQEPAVNEIVARILRRSKAIRRSTGDITGATAMRVDPKGGNGFVTVFWDRVMEEARLVKLSPELVMGHILAHELGHILLPEDGHSRRGIMQAQLQDKDWERASLGALVFTGEQAEAIRAGVRARGRR
ncbi:MAG: hypothetical protein GWN58_28010 [Anaerolineae bacterium]|nr:hypothetical protein [Anaerolineae bacterium]